MHGAGVLTSSDRDWRWRLRNTIQDARGIFAEDFHTMSATKEVRFAIVLKRTGSSLFVDSHSAHRIDGAIGCAHSVGVPGAVFLFVITFVHAATSSLRDSPQGPAKFPIANQDSREIALNLRGMTFAETNPQSCLAAKSGEHEND